MAPLSVDSLAALERAVSLARRAEHLWGLFTRRGGLGEGGRSLAANVTVALWLSVQRTCCFGGKAGGWYPTYLITDDVHHTSASRRRCETAVEGGGGRGRCLSVNTA